MIGTNEEALICDLAETYHVMDYRSLPVKLVATLSSGLRDNSRIAMELTEGKASTTNTILAVIADRLMVLCKMLGYKDEMPSIFSALYELDEKPKSNVVGFENGDDLFKALSKINGG